ncbi:MAG: septum formation inhibitor Maf [Leptolyngbyaceae cyanobacterium CSU_1_3]|nr:septum formation inhibitor Maf [Leptolyngbyaceae cyanobacterium CSU_1_3]
MNPSLFILASASPARRRLLQMVGIDAIAHPSNFDESLVQSSDPGELVKTLAEQKAATSMQSLWEQRGELQLAGLGRLFSRTPGVILGCDSVLAIAGEIHGKPANPEEAIARWKLMRGQVGQLYTGHALFSAYSEQGLLMPPAPIVRAQVTRVFFAEVSDRQIESYVSTGEPLSCAGCFALEGKGSLFIEKIEGCHTNVIGLSMPLLRQMLTKLGYDVTDFWA